MQHPPKKSSRKKHPWLLPALLTALLAAAAALPGLSAQCAEPGMQNIASTDVGDLSQVMPVVNFTHGVEKSQGYRMAFMRMSPLCESFIYRYGRESSGKSFEQRERDVKALIDCRASCEQLIFECHDTKNRHHEKTDPD